MTGTTEQTSSSRRSFLKVFSSWLALLSASIFTSNKVFAFVGARLPRARRVSNWYFWGNNLNGNFGNGVTAALVSTPVLVFSSSTWEKLVGGGDLNATTGYFTAGLKANDTLWGFGKNTHGQLAIGSTTDISTPVQAGSVSTWVDVYGSFSRYNLGLRTGGALYAWGQNPEGNLGDGTTTTRSTPVLIAGTWSTVAAGALHTLGIKSDGTLWGWGDASSGQVGNGAIAVKVSTPVQIQTGSTFLKIAAGHFNSYAVRSDGTLWAWGTNISGQMGNGIASAVKYSTPIQVGSLSTWAEVKAAGSVAFAKKNDSTYWCWGTNSQGQLGIGSTSGKSTPVQLPGTNWALVLPSWGFVIGLKTDGTLYSWGDGADGVLGTGSVTDCSTPVQIAGTWQKVFVGPRFVGGVKNT
jgi:alpha-tubulin suppressor-like RCC1 family protein